MSVQFIERELSMYFNRKIQHRTTNQSIYNNSFLKNIMEVNMSSKSLRQFLFFILIFSLLVNTFTSTNVSAATISGDSLDLGTVTEKVYSPLPIIEPDSPSFIDQLENNIAADIQITPDVVNNKSSGAFAKNNDIKLGEVIKPNEKIKKIKTDFTPLMKQITAYYYPELFSLLNEKQKSEIQSWDITKVNQNIKSLNKSQLKLLEKYAAIALVNYDYHTDRKAYVKKHPQTYSKEEEDADQQEITKKSKALKERQKKNSTTNAVYSASDISVVNEVKAPKKVMTLTDPSYKVTEFKNEYNYSIKTDALVDPLYQTANRSVTDISLSGKSELGLSFTRRYNSLNSKALTPEYNAVAGTYTQQTGNLTSPIDITQEPGFIAVGWSLNIPSMQKATIQAEVTESHYSVGCNSGSYQLTGSCYQSTYSYQGISSYEKVSFSLDTGESYEFRNEVIQNYPYQNVTYSKVLNGGHYEYSIILNETLTYKFDDQGHIISKTNQYGNQVLYSYGTAPNMDIIVTDSFGRVITVSRNSNLVITGVTVKLGTNVIKQLQYNSSQPSTSLTSRKWTTNGYQNVTENLSYWQLDNVKDSTTSTAVTQLESYDYYPIDSTTLADFNFKPDGYTVDGVGPNGEMLSNNQGVNNNNYWTPAWNWPVSEGGV